MTVIYTDILPIRNCLRQNAIARIAVKLTYHFRQLEVSRILMPEESDNL